MSSTVAPTDFPALVADTYARWTLDCLVEIAYAISIDFVSRPQLYQSDDIPDDIVNLRASYGADPDFPNTAQRQLMMTPVFGRSDGLKPDATNASAPFQMARKKLVDACVAFSERAVDSGIPMLEERVRSALIPFTAHLLASKGKSFQSSGGEIVAESDTAFQILRSSGVSEVFSVTKIDDDWPLQSNDPNGATLVEVAGVALSLSGDYKLSHTKFMLLQRVAVEGARALLLVLNTDPSNEDQLLKLISQVYTWGTSLRDFQQAP